MKAKDYHEVDKAMSILIDQEIFMDEEILNVRTTKAICERCGSCQTHGIVYCKECGNKYTIFPKTVLAAIELSYNRQNKSKYPYWINWSFLGALHKRQLAKENITPKQFTDYIQTKLNQQK